MKKLIALFFCWFLVLSGFSGTVSDTAVKPSVRPSESYRERKKLEEENKIKPGSVYVVDGELFKVWTRPDQDEKKDTLAQGDTITVQEKLPDGWYKISLPGGAAAFTTRRNLEAQSYLSGESAFLHKLSGNIHNIFDFTKFRSWIMVVIFAIILFFVRKYFVQLDRFLLRLKKGGDEYSDGASKASSKPRKKNFLHRIFPVRRYPWYPLMTGILTGAMLFAGSFWNAYEMEWYFNEGFSLIPTGLDRGIHWFLYIMSMVIILLTLTWFLESFVVAGPLVGLLRIFLLLILNFMSLLVSFFLLVLLAIIVVVMIALWIFGNTAGSGNYRCPKCGRSFSASVGSSVSCPGCGAGLST